MSHPKESFTALQDTYAGIAAEELIRPQDSSDMIVADGYDQIAVARQDEAALTAEGMPADLLSHLEEAVEGYSWAAGLIAAHLEESSEQKEAWQEKKNAAYALRRTLVRYGRFGCRLNDMPDVSAQIDLICEGRGDGDMIMDLLSLHQLFTAKQEITAGLTKFDPAWVTQALDLHNELKELRAALNNPAEDLNRLELKAKQAYTHYHRTVYRLREWGEFVFAEDPRFAAYQANFMQDRKS
jgi:hypothetical protein